jgi:hypothetical protein
MIGLCCACGGETAGEQIALRWQLAAGDEASRDFVTDTGWHVTLDDARVSIESVLLIAPASDSRGALASVRQWLVPVAHAHGEHDAADGQRVRAELLDPIVIDAAAERPRTLGTIPAEAGDVAAFKLMIARTTDDTPDELHGHAAAYVRGRAARDDVRVSFSGGVTLADSEPARRVERRIQFSLSELGTLTLGVQPSEWFREAEFARIATDDAEAEVAIDPASQVGRAWAIGLRSPEAFDLTWTAKQRTER